MAQPVEQRKHIGNTVAETDTRRDKRDWLTKSLSFPVFFLAPFLGGNHLALPGITIDRFWLESSFLLALIAAVSISFLKGLRPRPGYSTFLLFFAPLLIISGCSLFYTWNLYNTVRELNVLVWVLGAAYLWLLSSDKEDPFHALVLGSVATVVCAVLQFKILFPLLSEVFTAGRYASMLQEKPVPFAAFLNENMFGGFLLLVLPISMFLATSKQKTLYFITTGVLILGILLSLSRLSMVVMALELLSMGFIFLLARNYRSIVKLIVCTAAGAMLFFVLVHYNGSPAENRVEQSFRGKTTTALTQVKTLNLRTSIWQAANEAFQERPLLGYGAGAFEYGYRKHFDGRLYTRYSHGSLAKIAVELGALGLIASLWYLFGIVRNLRNRGPSSPFLLTALFGALLFAFVDCALDTAAFVVVFFAVSSQFLTAASNENHFAKKYQFLPLMVVLLFSFAFTGRADLAKKTVEEGGLFEEMGNRPAAASSYVQAALIMPIDNEPRIRHITLVTAGKTNHGSEQDRQEIARAIDNKWNVMSLVRDKDSELFYVNALASKILGRDTSARKYISDAMELYPSSPYYVAQAAGWLLSDGDYGGADHVIKRFQPFIDNIRAWGNPYGLYVYRLRELTADIEYKKGNIEEAIILGERNLNSAKNDEFIITSYKAREFVKKEWLIDHLARKLTFYKSGILQ